MNTFDILVGILLVFIILFVAVTSMRVMYNATKDAVAPLGIRVSQWITFIGILTNIIILINL